MILTWFHSLIFRLELHLHKCNNKFYYFIANPTLRSSFCNIFVPLCLKLLSMQPPKLSRSALIGYPAGIITGVTYGLNPLFGVPLMQGGAAVESILFFRYGIAVLLLGAFLWLTKQSFRVLLKQGAILLSLGGLYACSSICLFEAYNYIASGLATTLVFLFPVLVAIIMVLLKVVPSWPV